jgi:deoxyribonuclease V
MVHVTPAFSIKKARRTQSRLAKQIVFEDDLPKRLHLVAGVDVAYAQERSVGAVAVLDYDSLELVETQTATCKTRFPYVPTLLSFREVPPAVLSIKRLKSRPDVFLVDGHGFAHPFRCGFACHLGLIMNRPTIGVAKSKLFGEVEETRTSKNVAFLKHEDEVIGAEILTEAGRKPIYVSVGHMVSLKTAVEIVRHCTQNSRIPKPILEAHKLATTEKRKINIE